MSVSYKIGIAHLTDISQPRSALEAALMTRSSPVNGDDRALSLIVTLHVDASMGRQLTVQPHLLPSLKLLVTGVPIAQCGLLHPLRRKVLQDARTHLRLPRRARRTKKRRGLLAENSSRAKRRERGVNLARSEHAVTCLLLLAHPTRLQIVTGGAGHEPLSRHAVALLVCDNPPFPPRVNCSP